MEGKAAGGGIRKRKGLVLVGTTALSLLGLGLFVLKEWGADSLPFDLLLMSIGIGGIGFVMLAIPIPCIAEISAEGIRMRPLFKPAAKWFKRSCSWDEVSEIRRGRVFGFFPPSRVEIILKQEGSSRWWRRRAVLTIWLHFWQKPEVLERLRQYAPPEAISAGALQRPAPVSPFAGRIPVALGFVLAGGWVCVVTWRFISQGGSLFPFVVWLLLGAGCGLMLNSLYCAHVQSHAVSSAAFSGLMSPLMPAVLLGASAMLVRGRPDVLAIAGYGATGLMLGMALCVFRPPKRAGALWPVLLISAFGLAGVLVGSSTGWLEPQRIGLGQLPEYDPWTPDGRHFFAVETPFSRHIVFDREGVHDLPEGPEVSVSRWYTADGRLRSATEVPALVGNCIVLNDRAFCVGHRAGERVFWMVEPDNPEPTQLADRDEVIRLAGRDFEEATHRTASVDGRYRIRRAASTDASGPYALIDESRDSRTLLALSLTGSFNNMVVSWSPTRHRVLLFYRTTKIRFFQKRGEAFQTVNLIDLTDE